VVERSDTTGYRPRPASTAPSQWDASTNKGSDMSSTFISLHYHIVFSTKKRQPLIDKAWRERLHKYLGGTVNGLHCKPGEPSSKTNISWRTCCFAWSSRGWVRWQVVGLKLAFLQDAEKSRWCRFAQPPA